MSAIAASLTRPDLVEKNYGTASNLAFNEMIKKMISNGELIYHFGFGQAPFPVIEKATEALKKQAGQNEYLPVKGTPELRKGICKFHQYYDGLTFDPDQVIVGTGSKELLLLLITVFNGVIKHFMADCRPRQTISFQSLANLLGWRLEHEDVCILGLDTKMPTICFTDILVNSPSWTTYKPQAILAGRPVYAVDSREEEDWRVTPQGIEKVLQQNNVSPNKLLILCNPCNPTGTSYTERQLQELTAICRQNNIFIVSDEIYARLHYDQGHLSMSRVYPEGTILSAGFSKWSSAGGWRVGYHIYPKELYPLLKTVACAGSHSYSCAPAPMQFALTEVMNDLNACDEYIYHTCRVMKEVGLFCARELRSVGVTVCEPTAGYYIFPNFEVIRPALQARGLTTGDQMCELMLKEARVAVLAGGPAHLRPAEELTTRLCFVNFQGEPALAESRRIGSQAPLGGSEFVKEFCRPVYDGIEALKHWVTKLKAEAK